MESNEALAELDFKITEVDLSGVARGDPPQTPIKSIELGGKSNKAIAELDLAKYLSSLDFGCLRSFGLSQFELHLFGLQGLRKDFFCKMT